MSEPRWRRYLRFWRRDISSDVDDELRFHFAQRVEQYRAAGMSQAEAEVAAVAQFGDVGEVRKRLVGIDARAARATDASERAGAVLADLRTTIRSLRRQPAFAAAIIITLSLGLGVNAAVFSFLDRVFFRAPAGILDPQSLRRLWSVEHDKGQPVALGWRVGVDEYRALGGAVGGDARLALHMMQRLVSIDRDEDPVTIMRASANYLPLLGVRATRGRLFNDEEAVVTAPARVAVISDDLWRSRYGADPSVLGKRVTLSDIPYTIIGVAPPGFSGVDLERTDIWVPLGMEPLGMGGSLPRGQGFAFVLARLSPRVSDEAIAQRATAIMRHAHATDPEADSLAFVAPGSIIAANGPGTVGKEYVLATRLGGVAVIILLIACANIVNLLLARAVARRREIAVRLALGASRVRLIWLLAVPTMLLAVMAGCAAVASAALTAAVLRSQLVPDIHFAESAFHWRVFPFTMVVALFAGALSAIIPAIQGSRLDVITFLKAGAQSGAVQRSRLRSTLIAMQVALSLVLVAGAGLFLRSVRNVESIRLGYDVPRLVSAGVRLANWGSPDSVSLAQIADRIRLIPGVEMVAQSTMFPLGRGLLVGAFYTGADSAHGSGILEKPPFMAVSPNYFAVAGIRIVRGRDFLADPMAWSIVVNETMAKEYWPNSDAIGQCMRLNKPTNPCYTVVGVSENAHAATVIEKERAHYYVSLAHPPSTGMRGYTIIMRAAPQHVASVIGATRRALLEAFPNGRPTIRRTEDDVASAYRPFQLGATLFSGFGLLALLVAVVGVYSTVSYTVNQRTHEFGVRIALGAQVSNVLSRVLRTALVPVVVGVVLGVAAALASGRLIASLLYGVSPSDMVVMLGSAAILIGAAVLAALVPAKRAAGVDPIIALRAD